MLVLSPTRRAASAGNGSRTGVVRRLVAAACACMVGSTAPLYAQDEGAVTRGARLDAVPVEGRRLAGGGERVTADGDTRRSLRIAVYNNGHALVRESRQLPLLEGVNQVAVTDVAHRLRPESIRLKAPSGVLVQGQQFHAGAPGYQRLLEAQVGEAVILVRENPATGEQVTRRAQLLALTEDGRPVLRVDGRVEVGGGDYPWRIAFDRLPGGLAWRTTITAQISAEQSRAVDLGVSYITAGLGWQADYDLVIPAGTNTASLSGWARIGNDSGTDFANARLELIAGDVAVTADESDSRVSRTRLDSAVASSAERSSLGGAYHRYELPRRVSLRHGETRQLPLLELSGVPVRRLYRASHRAEPRQQEERRPQPVSLELAVAGGDQRKEPLPAGVVRVYEQDADGRLHWLGEDRIDHTPVDAPVTLTVGRAFDVQAERRQTDQTRLSDRSYEAAWEITLSNASGEPVDVAVDEQLNGDWEVLEAEPSPASKDAQQLSWRVTVDAGASTTIRYRVRVKY